MPSFWDRINPIGSKSWITPIANKNFRKGAKNLLTGTPEKRENVSTLRPEQEALYQQAVNAGMGEGAGGAFGTSADYYRNLLSDNPSDMNAFAAPEIRRFNEETVPGLSEQFAGFGAGGLGSSGFRNAQLNAGTDLAERLGAIRANLRQSGAQGLQQIGQTGLGNYSQNMVTEQGSEGLLPQAAKLLPHAAAAYFTGGQSLPASAAMLSNQNSFGGNKVGQNSSPYGGGNPQTSPQLRPQNNFQLPNFNVRAR